MLGHPAFLRPGPSPSLCHATPARPPRNDSRSARSIGHVLANPKARGVGRLRLFDDRSDAFADARLGAVCEVEVKATMTDKRARDAS